MTRSFAPQAAPEVKVNSIAPSLILFNEHDDAEYRQQALNKSLMKNRAWRERSDRPGRLLTYQLLCHRTQFPT
ncbi:putative short chain dehydrogenase [Escherichia coli]|nr:putative short chain dehydrogenase [Escherichia coli]